MKCGTNNKEIITKVVDVNDIPNPRRGRNSGYARDIVNEFMASDARAIAVSRQDTKASDMRTALRTAARRIGIHEDIICTKRGEVVYLIKREAFNE